MGTTIPRTFHRHLISEINRWQEEKLIAPELAASLIARYPEPVTKNRLITILSMLGSILMGLGALLFIGSNWEHLTKLLKVELIVLAILLTNLLAWRFRFVPGNRPRLGSALFLTGNFFFGAGVWLISQIFNMDISLANGLLLWAIGAGAMALAVRSAPLGCLTAILLGSYNLCPLGHTFSSSIDATRESLLQFALVFSISVWLAYFLRSPWSMILTLAGGAFWVAINTSTLGLLAYGIALFAIYLCHRLWWQPFAPAFLYAGTIASLFALFFMTFSHGDYAVVPSNGYLIAFASLITLIGVSIKYRQFGVEATAGGLVLLAGWFCSAILSNLSATIVGNLVMFAAMLGLIFVGLYRLRSATIVNITLVFFVIDITARYFDTFFKMLDRSVFFVMGGLMLVILGSYLEQTRRKLLEGINV
jgi:uncharacterized membrane protein